MAGLLFLLLGIVAFIVQGIGYFAGAEEWIGMPGWLALITFPLVAFIPFAGIAFVVISAWGYHYVFDFSWPAAIALAAPLTVLQLSLGISGSLMMAAADMFKGRRARP